jgi:radical SAM protein with 4Fe4S-binding SPASM domain
MNLDEKLQQLQQQYDVVATVNLDLWHDLEEYETKLWFNKILSTVYKEVYQPNQRILFTLTTGDVYSDGAAELGKLMYQLQIRLNEIDISNYFVVLLTNDMTIPESYNTYYKKISKDAVPINIIVYDEKIKKRQIQKSAHYDYNNVRPIKINVDKLSTKHRDLLVDSSVFCIYPWVHLHAYPTGDAYPCCQADMQFPIGDLRQNTIEQVWNQTPMKQIRRNMLTGKSVEACTRCYEQEKSGFFSGRQNANKHHGHHIHKVDLTQDDGHLDDFEMVYWDIRFNNLCNLSCRSCGHIFSSSWYKDQVALSGPEWKEKNTVLNYAGRTSTDIWEQLIPHLDYVEQIYFAGGEPLMMEEHYNILDELERRGRFDVRLIYNTNFTQVKLKDRWVFDYWKKFQSVSVGASLDDMGARAEYIRNGTDWSVVEHNRKKMMEICPDVDFYISPTLSIMNADHICEFHRYMVDQGFLRPHDININILQDPPWYRIDMATDRYKKRIVEKFEKHLEWLEPLDPLKRATNGFKSSIKFMLGQDNSYLLPKFWQRTEKLDSLRNQDILQTIPELAELK